MWLVTVTGPEETFSLGRVLGQLAREGDVVCLSGELGAGKTVMAKGIAAGVGVEDPATSPSFTLVHEYRGRLLMYHLDLYRLEAEAVWDLGLGEYLGQGITVVEWPEKLGTLLPPGHLWVSFDSAATENERLLCWKAVGSRHQRLLEGMRRKCASWAWKRQAGQ